MHTLKQQLLIAALAVLASTGGWCAGPEAATPSAPAAAATSVPRPSLSLSPSVVMLEGRHGQSVTRAVRLTNHTAHPFTFQMEARDVVTRDGKRVFVPAGELPGSIAATAVFAERQVTVAPGETRAVPVTLTVGPQTGIRAVVVVFRSAPMPSSNGSVRMTASLGSLFTFNLSDNARVQPSEIVLGRQDQATNLQIAQALTNVGSEPVVPSGVVAFLNANGRLVTKVPLEQKRLLPGERLEFRAEYPSVLPPGSYRAVVSFDVNGKTVTNTAEFSVL
jgi:hypothetical protein